MRFRTRLALTTTAFTSFVILVVTLLVLVLSFLAILEHYRDRGLMLNRLVQNNVAYASQLPELVMARVADQMVMNALLAAELVNVAAISDEVDNEVVSAALKRAINRSTELHGHPLVDEFWVTDEEGRATIHTADFDFTFAPGTGIRPHTASFQKLLEDGAKPIIQELKPRAQDGAAYQYVGVTGVQKPRIVQVGMSRERVEAVQEGFTVQAVIENFVTDREVERIAVLTPGGRVLASTDDNLPRGEQVREFKLAALVNKLNRQQDDDIAMDEFANSIGVATRTQHLTGIDTGVLFIQYRTARFFTLVKSAVRHVLWAGLVLILVSMIISLWVARRFSKPLTELSDAAIDFGRGRLERRLDIKGDREIRAVADAFNHMATSLQTYMQTLRHEARQRERLESEFRIASQLQRRLLPQSPPPFPNIEVAAACVAAHEVGGDFYDYVRMGERRLAIAIGDATGHGLSAALLISECWSIMRAFAEATPSAAELLYRTNNALCQRVGDTGRFATLFVTVLDTHTGKMRFSVAGHNPPFVLTANGKVKFALCSEMGLPLGVQQNCEFEEAELVLEAGESIAFYSDGITEAHAPDNTPYGVDRLQHQLYQNAEKTPRRLIDAVLADVRAHMQRDEPADDMTLVLLRFHGAGS